MSMLAVVINTCAGSVDPETLARLSSFGKKRAYAERASKLTQVIEHYVEAGIQVVVVGEWKSGLGYYYIHCPGPGGHPGDAAMQRHVATNFVLPTTEIVVFLNDDHALPAKSVAKVPELIPEGGVLAFGRQRLNAGKTTVLEDGWPDYVMGHACAMTWRALEKVPWSAVAHLKYKQDIEHTALLRAVDVPIVYVPELKVYDIEEGDLPWPTSQW